MIEEQKIPAIIILKRFRRMMRLIKQYPIKPGIKPPKQSDWKVYIPSDMEMD
jgi:hypothetical protein